MPTEKTSTRAMTGKRVLNQGVSELNLTLVLAEGWKGQGSWLPIQAGSVTGVYSENYFDLSGYELDDLTLVPEFLQLQDGLPYFAGTNVTTLRVFDIVSQERINPLDIYLDLVTGGFPGSTNNPYDWSQILMCNFRYFLPQTDFTDANLMLPATSGSFGSSEPTAVQKLWTYRIVITGGLLADGDVLNLPATRFVLGGEVIKEGDLEYMMRLKRSYELSTQG